MSRPTALRDLFRDMPSEPEEADLERAGVPQGFRSAILKELRTIHAQWASGDRVGAEQRAANALALASEAIGDDLEEGAKMSRATNPLRGFWDTVARGATPSDDDIQAEGFPPGRVAVVRGQVKAIHALKAEGRFADARTLGRDYADDWLKRLGPDWIAPSKATPWPDDPREAAARIARGI